MKYFLNKLIWMYITVYILIMLFACNNNFKLDKKLINWESKQRYKVYEMAINTPEKFISIGFFSQSNFENAIDSAKLEAMFLLPQIIKLYVKTQSTYIINSGNNKQDKFSNKILTVGNVSISNEPEFKLISKFEDNGKYFVAIIAIVDRNDVINNYMQYTSHSKSDREKKFNSDINDQFLKSCKKLIINK
ncbi:MAG: hypothetical protein K8R58_04360 [Bacteroidales bacterium]|nr:hypothetical protein [Bacteroidales bacterium]